MGGTSDRMPAGRANVIGTLRPLARVTARGSWTAALIAVLLFGLLARPALGDFSAKTDFTVGSFPHSVALGDLNGDGRPDLVTANLVSDNASVLLNTTAPGAAVPTFSSRTDFTMRDGPESVALADLNGDGMPDLAVANDTNSRAVSVLLNTAARGAVAYTFAACRNLAIGLLRSSGAANIAAAPRTFAARPADAAFLILSTGRL
jgi:hypothetical protein